MEMETKILTAGDILGAQDVQFETVEVPEWGGSVRLRSLTARQIAKFVDSKREDSATLAVALSIVDADGNQQFTEADCERLKDRNISAIMRIQEAVMSLNRLKADDGAAKAKKA
jgi:hypothetical protein